MERKFKIGDKVRVVAIKHTEETKSRKYLGQEFVINSYCKDNTYGLYGSVSIWYENELELVKETLFDRIKSSIIEASKNAPIIVEQTEDGGIKISSIDEKPQPRKSGIYYNEERNNTYVVFGGGIHVAVGENIEGQVIAFQQLNEIKECGEAHNEEWVKGKTTVNLVINNKNTIKILRDALKIVEEQLNKED